jgi:hypothetical protein
VRTHAALLLAAVVAAALLAPGASATRDPGRASDRALAAVAADDSIWSGGGAFVHNEGNIDPKTLAQNLRSNGFRWAVVILHDGISVDPVESGWIERFRAAAGSAVALGGWGVLRDNPEREAALAAQLVDRHGLDFYIANAEMEYKYSGDDGYSGERYGRSKRFVDVFRGRLPAKTAALSSYCRADRHDIDWAVWRDAGFHFLPQAYANDFGADFGPGGCAAGAGAFPVERVHPTLGTYPSAYRVSADQYVTMLSASPTTGFSIYLAEVDMTPAKWKTYGRAVRAEVGVSAWPAPDSRPVVQITGLVPPPGLKLYTSPTLPVTARGEVTLHFFASREGQLRIEAGAAPVRTVPIRAGQNLFRLSVKSTPRPSYLGLTAVSRTGLAGKTFMLRLRYPAR